MVAGGAVFTDGSEFRIAVPLKSRRCRFGTANDEDEATAARAHRREVLRRDGGKRRGETGCAGISDLRCLTWRRSLRVRYGDRRAPKVERDSRTTAAYGA